MKQKSWMKENIIKKKSFEFALRIIKLYQHLKTNKNEYVLSKQLLRSGTAIGALVAESEDAQSKADFIHKMSIAQKEANETLYWIELLGHSNLIDQTQLNSLMSDINEVRKILASIIISSKANK